MTWQVDRFFVPGTAPPYWSMFFWVMIQALSVQSLHDAP